MSSFAAHIETWHDFYMLAGTAAATLLGLLFVGVSLQRETRGWRAHPHSQRMAEQSFQHLLIVILFALYFLIPDPSPSSIGWPVLLTSLFPLPSLARGVIAYRDPHTRPPAYGWRVVVPFLCYLGALCVGAALVFGADDAVGWMVAVIALLLMIPTRNAWALLLNQDELPEQAPLDAPAHGKASGE